LFTNATDDKPQKIVYFTNRFEMGHCSTYKKLLSINEMLTASTFKNMKINEEREREAY
jgi:hypothetical protein